MKKFLIAATAVSGLFAFVGPASAADAAIEPAYDWTGFYLGAHAGYGWGDSDVTAGAGAGGMADHDIEGFVAGIHGGYNFQADNIVFGIEGDAGFSDVDGDSSCSNPAVTCFTDLDWLASVRGRLGFAIDNLLIYGTGGVAFTDIKFENDVNAGPGGDTQKKSAVGYVVGGGAEYGVSDSISVRVEGLYYDFGSTGFRYDNSAFDYDGEVDIFVIRGGVSFLF